MSIAIGGAALAASVLVIGGVLRWTQAIVAGLLAIGFALQLGSRRKLAKLSPLIALIGLAIAFTAIQLIPLPTSVISAVNDTGSSLRTDGAALADTWPWQCLSMDPAGTLRGLAFLVILLGVAVTSLRFAATERGRYLLVAGVAIACALAAVVTGVHTLVNADSLYGIYTPQHATPPILGPLLNPNHLGCLMALGATISVGLAFYESQSVQWRVLWVVSAMLCAIVAFSSLSRGATISLALGMAVTGCILIGRSLRQSSSRRRSNQLPIALVVGVGLAVAVYSSAGNVVDQLDRTSMVEINHQLSKFAAWKSSVELIGESPWVGVGRGAVEPTFTRVHPASATNTFSHLENEYIQAVVEWGVPAALVLALALAWCIITALRHWRDGPLAAAALGGIAGVMFQSSVDFGIEIIGLAVPATIIAATIQIVPLRETSRPAGPRLWRGLMIAMLVGASVALMLPLTADLQEDHDALLAENPPTVDDLHAAMQRHPLDYFAFAMMGDKLLKEHNSHAVYFINHALELHPTHPGLHRLAARMLIATGHKNQAAVEYASALTGIASPHLLLGEILANLPAPADAARAIPIDYYNFELVLRSLRELGRTDVSEAWLARIVAQPQPELAMIDRLYNLAMLRGSYAVAIHTAQIRLKVAANPESRFEVAQAEFKNGDYDATLSQLADVQTWTNRIDDHVDAWLLACRAQSELRHWDDALACVHHLDASGLAVMRRTALSDLERDIEDRDKAEMKAKQIQDMEKQMHLPVDTYFPVVPTHPTFGGGSDSRPAGMSGLPIQNPIKNPLKRP